MVCDAPDPETFRRAFAEPNIPVLIKNATHTWNARTAWTPESFSSRYADVWVRVVRTDNSEARAVTVKEYFQSMFNAPDPNPYYLKDWVFEEDCPELMQDYAVPPYFSNWLDFMEVDVRPKLRWLYIGPAGSGSSMHLDTMDTSAWNAVLSGRKLWLFFPPEQAACVYNGGVDAFHPDFKKFPLLEGSAPIFCVQDPGDIVFTPSGYWHQVFNEKAGFSVTENFVNHSNFAQVERYFIQNGMKPELDALYDIRNKALQTGALG